MCFTLYSRPAYRKDELSDKDTPLGWVATPLFDYKHELHTGLLPLQMWPDDKANPIGNEQLLFLQSGPCVSNSNPNVPVLFVQMDSYPLPVAFPTEPAKG